jgi:hypothetical protein
MTDRPENEDSHELVPRKAVGIARASTSNLAGRALELSKRLGENALQQAGYREEEAYVLL